METYYYGHQSVLSYSYIAALDNCVAYIYSVFLPILLLSFVLSFVRSLFIYLFIQLLTNLIHHLLNKSKSYWYHSSAHNEASLK